MPSVSIDLEFCLDYFLKNVFTACARAPVTSGRVSVSVLRVKTVDSQPGKEATLTCSRICQQSCLTFWFKWVSGTNAVCVSVMIGDGAKPGYCEGYKSGKFVMGVTNSSVFLNIIQVDVSDSGSYFCGFYTERLLYFTGVQLNIKGKMMSKEFPK